MKKIKLIALRYFWKIRDSSNFGFYLCLGIYRFVYYIKYEFIPLRYRIKKQFKKYHKYCLNLEKPVTLNEKIQYLKLVPPNNLIIQCVDKIAVREYVKEKIGNTLLIPKIWQSDNVRELVPDKLPHYEFILKTNHAAGTNYIVHDKREEDWCKIRRKFKWWLKFGYGKIYGELAYDKVPRKVFAEELLLDKNGEIPYDYKFHFINGNLQFIQVDIDRFSNHCRNLYDKEWNLLPFNWSLVDMAGTPLWPNGKNIPKPREFNEMYVIASKLADQWPYVRVDLYLFEGKVYFGELTFFHGGGYERFVPNVWDEYFGDMLDLTSIKLN